MSGRYDDENIIIEDWRCWRHDFKPHFLTNSPLEKQIYEAIMENWETWISNNSHSALPPDFYSNELGFAFDVVRVFDSESEIVNPSGRIQRFNPTLIEQSKLYNQCLREHPDAQPNEIFIIPKPEADYHNVHTYEKYCSQANRVISEHIAKVDGWRERHPNCKMGLLIFDETAIYIQHALLKDAIKPINLNKKYIFHPRPHNPAIDKNLVSHLVNSDLDFYIWLSFYKLNCVTRVQIPAVTIVDLKRKNKIHLKDYPPELMRCT